ncbi:MAG: hypothetical protein NTV22_05930 [bacterium]|nr:hypothetical protein [bacterium]
MRRINANYLWRIVRRGALAVAVAAALWLLLPPALSDTSLLRDACERHLGRLFNARVELEQVNLTTWSGGPTFVFSALTFYNPSNDVILAYSGNCRLHVDFLPLLLGHIVARDVTISRIDFDLPTTALQDFLVRRGYLSKPILTPHALGMRETFSLRAVTADVRGAHGTYALSARGKCELPNLRQVRFTADVLYHRRTRRTTIAQASIAGVHVNVRHIITPGAAPRTLREHLPFSCSFAGAFSPDDVDVKALVLSGATWHVQAQLSADATNTHFQIDLPPQSLQWSATRWLTQAASGFVHEVVCHISGRTDPRTRTLMSDVLLKARAGCLRGIAFSNVTLTAELDNDRISTLTAYGYTLDGIGQLNLVDNLAARQADQATATNSVLLGDFILQRVALDQLLACIAPMPVRCGGTLTARGSFEMDNLRVTDLLTRRLTQLGRFSAKTDLIISNAMFQAFTGEQWLLAPDVPAPLRTLLSMVAQVSGASLNVPLLTRTLRGVSLKAPRTITTHLVLNDGALATPDLRATTPLGVISAAGMCDTNGVMDYLATLQLAPALVAQYGTHPLLGMFTQNNKIEIPLRVRGTLAQPRAELRLTDPQRTELEERLTMVITAHLQQRLGGGGTNQAMSAESQQLQKSVQRLIRQLL